MIEQKKMTNGTIVQGAGGAAVTFGSLVVSVLPQIEIGLRIAGLIVGLLVGIVTLVSMIRKLKNDKQNNP